VSSPSIAHRDRPAQPLTGRTHSTTSQLHRTHDTSPRQNARYRHHLFTGKAGNARSQIGRTLIKRSGSEDGACKPLAGDSRRPGRPTGRVGCLSARRQKYPLFTQVTCGRARGHLQPVAPPSERSASRGAWRRDSHTKTSRHEECLLLRRSASPPALASHRCQRL